MLETEAVIHSHNDIVLQCYISNGTMNTEQICLVFISLNTFHYAVFI